MIAAPTKQEEESNNGGERGQRTDNDADDCACAYFGGRARRAALYAVGRDVGVDCCVACCVSRSEGSAWEGRYEGGYEC